MPYRVIAFALFYCLRVSFDFVARCCCGKRNGHHEQLSRNVRLCLPLKPATRVPLLRCAVYIVDALSTSLFTRVLCIQLRPTTARFVYFMTYAALRCVDDSSTWWFTRITD